MSDDIVKSLHELLNEEKWTRATLNSYSINNFKELDVILEQTIKEKKQKEVKEICDEHLTHTKNSIIALYFSGIIALSWQLVDDSNLVKLITIFTDNRKWNIVEFLCNRILEFGENRFALRTLAECYDNENEEEKKYSIWERLIKVDYEETEIVKHIAEKKEKDGDLEAAVEYYKKAIHRFIGKKMFSNVKDIWHKLLEYTPEDTDFFFHVENKIAKAISGERASQLLEELYEKYKGKDDWDKCIEILKRILEYDSKNAWARKEITDCFKEKYKDHSQLDEYIKLSNLTQSWRNVHDAIADFEKHISFDAGNFVCHRSWGIGRIAEIDDNDIKIDFARKRGHAMSLKMAVNALNILDRDHIWVLKVISKKEDLRQKVKTDIPWTLRTIIKSFDNQADMKKIKSELVPSVLTPGEWSSWSTSARKILKTDPMFGIATEKIDQFVVRENPISFDEKIFNKFKAEKNFFDRIQTIKDFIKSNDLDSEYFNEMFDFFVGFLKAFNAVNEYVIASFLFVRDLVKQYPYLNPGIDYTFSDLFDQIEDVELVFSRIDDPDIKREFLHEIKQNISGWQDLFIRFFPYFLNRYIIEELNSDNKEKYKELIFSIVDNYRDYREAFVWLSKLHTEPWFQELDIQFEKILIGLIHLLDISYREIDNRRDVSLNRKLNKQIQNFLFKEQYLENYIDSADEDSISRIYTLVQDVKDLDPSLKIKLRHKIMQKYPEFRFYGVVEKDSIPRGLLVTQKSYEERTKRLQHILEVEVPANSKEIGAAMDMGDLRENAEYKAAKEKQEILNSTAAKLKEDLNKAQIFKPDMVDISSVSFGAKVVLESRENGKFEEYSIFGPWESDPNNNIISYLSPFGSALLNHKPGEELIFTINERKYHYELKEISPAQFK